MTVKQYTIRNIPTSVDRYLRKRVQLSGKSLNQVIIEELSEKATATPSSNGNALDWFVGSGIDEETLQALAQEDTAQKELARKELIDDV